VGRAIGKRISDIAGDILSSSDSSPVHGSSHREAVDDIYQKMQARIEAQEKKAAESTKVSGTKPKRKPAVRKERKPKS
jgi:hypothetical protein